MDGFTSSYTNNFNLGDAVHLSLLLLLLIYVIFSSILFYHWKSYSSNHRITSITLIVYFSTTIPLLVLMGILTLVI
jgi:hypothetical protein